MAEPHTHQVKLSTYFGTFGALVVLATVSLLLTGLPDTLAVTLSLIIALIKSIAVLLFFMHLIEEPFSSRFVMLVATLLVAVLVLLTTLDPLTRAPFPPPPSDHASYPPAATALRSH